MFLLSSTVYIGECKVYVTVYFVVMKMSVCPAGDQDVRYTAVSGFIFLRFFAAAVLTPSLFQLRPHYPVSSRLGSPRLHLPRLPRSNPPPFPNLYPFSLSVFCPASGWWPLSTAGNVTWPFPQDPSTSRTLTLISKTIQTLGSLSKSKSVSYREGSRLSLSYGASK